MTPRHIHDIAAMCSSERRAIPVAMLTAVLMEEIKQDRLMPLTVGELVGSGLLTEKQVEQAGVQFQHKFQAAGYREGEVPLNQHDIFLRSKSHFVTRLRMESWARREEVPINLKGWQ